MGCERLKAREHLWCLRRNVEPGVSELSLYSKVKIGNAHPFPLPFDDKCGKVRNWFQDHGSPYGDLEINGSGTIRVVKLPGDTEVDFRELHVVRRV